MYGDEILRLQDEEPKLNPKASVKVLELSNHSRANETSEKAKESECVSLCWWRRGCLAARKPRVRIRVATGLSR